MVVVDGCWLLLALTSAYYFLATLYKRVAPQEARQLPRGGGICRYGACWAGTQEPWVAADARQLPRGGGICRYGVCWEETQGLPPCLRGGGPGDMGPWHPTPAPPIPVSAGRPACAHRTFPVSFVTWHRVASGSTRAVAALAAV
jgi:hypothetical protein